MPSLSVATYVDNPIKKEFPFKELIESVWDIAEEIIVINGDYNVNDIFDTWFSEREIPDIVCGVWIDNCQEPINCNPNIKIYHNPWEWNLGKNMGRLQRSLAISHCTKDYILLLDADEILHEKDYEKIKTCMKMGHDVYSFRTLHFYRDYNHIKYGPNPSDPGQIWYDHRPKLFKNNLGIIDMHDYNGNYSGLITFDGIDCQEVAKNTSIEIFHVGHVRSKKAYIKKTNDIERSYHPDWKDIKESEFEWDLYGTKLYEGTYPKVMMDRINKHKQKYPEYYGMER